MGHDFSDAAAQRLQGYLDGLGKLLGDKRRRSSFATYVMGLLSNLERKSVEPIAAWACPDVEEVDATHQRLLGFIGEADWNDQIVRRHAARYALDAIQKREPVLASIIDDTGFLKQGNHSVGVQRQYTGSAGKIANCQIGVSLCFATADLQIPIDFDLYVPRSWTNDPARRAEAGIPDWVQFQTKPQIALAQLRRAVADGLPCGPVVTDTAYGDSSSFRRGVRALNLHYAVAVSSNVKVWLVDQRGRRSTDAIAVGALGRSLPDSSFRRVTWREGTRRGLSARFAFRRAVPFHDDGTDPSKRERVWLVIEWEDGERQPTKFYFVTLPPSTTHKTLVRLIKRRWRTERQYEDLKGELGLDHFEGRGYRGWYHHVSVVMVCCAFVLAEHGRAFPPSGPRETRTDPQRCAS